MRTIDQINTQALCVLKLNPYKNFVNIEYVPIEKNFSINSKFDGLTKLNIDENSSVANLISYSEDNLHELLQDFSHCESLKNSYQQLPKNSHNQFLSRFLELNKRLSELKQEESFKITSIQDEIISLKKNFYDQMLRRVKAIEINKSYKICENENTILTFSHRRIGWSNPSYKLTPNFTFDIKTNFGYGHVSYFYTKLIFKGLEIIPFSDWVYYPKANFSEIIRFSKKHELEDKDWFIALSYARDACNLSLTNETAFIDKYIISECESMVSELESILSKNEFEYHHEFIKNEYQSFKIDSNINKIVLKSHSLIEYRGEKISGALNFIEKILLFENIRNMSSFVNRIKDVNLKVLPILKNEIPLIASEINTFNIQEAQLKNDLKSLTPDYELYKKMLQEFLVKEKLNNPTLTVQLKTDIESNFFSLHPELLIVKEKHSNLNIEITETFDKIVSLEKTHHNIKLYIDAINKFFKNSN